MLLALLTFLALTALTPCALAQTVTTNGPYTVLRYTTVGSANFTVPADVFSVEYVIVGGGGGGGSNRGGGGGAGGVRFGGVEVQPGASYVVTVGAGGAEHSNGEASAVAFASVITADGGGAGGIVGGAGSDGGSGGGHGAGTNLAPSYSNPVMGPFAQGSSGASGSSDASYGAGGGGGGFSGPGGTGVAGPNAPLSNTGGPGYVEELTGTSLHMAGGGGGGVQRSNDAAAGGAAEPGDGGGDGTGTVNAGNGTPGTGGGGGGGGSTVTGIGSAGGSGGSGTVILRYLTPAQAPVNDAFANRLALSGVSTSVSGSNVGATAEPGEPTHYYASAAKSVWWQWVAPGSGTVTISTVGSGYDTLLAVYTGSALAELTPVASDDDNGGDATSLVSFEATSGTAYQIAVDGYGAGSGPIMLHVTLGDPPPNTAPVNTAPVSVTGGEDTPIIFQSSLGTGISVSDADGNLTSLTLTVTKGILTSNVTPSTSNTGLGSSTVTFTGSASSINNSISSLVFLPTPDYYGAATLTVLSTDSGTPALTDTDVIAITVVAAADAAVDTLTTPEDTPITANVLTGTNGANADSFAPGATVVAVTQGAHGSVSFAASGAITYTPAPNYNGSDAFTYTVSSGGVTEVGNVTANVTTVNDAPSLAAISLPATIDTTFAFTAAYFTSAYSDLEGTALASITIATLPATGTLKLSGLNVTAGQTIAAANLANLTYVPASGESGAKTLTVTASDGAASSPPAVVTLTLLAAPPSIVTFTAASLSIGTSGEAVLVETAAVPAGAQIVGVDLQLDYSTYWPPSNPAYAGNYVKLNGVTIDPLGWGSLGNSNGWTPQLSSFRGTLPAYVAGTLNTWTIGSLYNPVALRNLSIRVYYTGGNQSPALAAISLAGTEDTTFAFTAANFTAAYSDPESAALASITVVTLPATGTLKLSGVNVTAGQVIPAASLGNLTYVPALNSNGPQAFTVTASDGTASSAAAAVTVTLATVNDPPAQTAPATASFAEDTPFAFTGANAITVADVDGNLSTTHLEAGRGKLTVSLTGGATLVSGTNNSSSLTLGGTLVQINASLATLVYTPAADYNGADSLLILSTDTGAFIASNTVNFTITPVADIVADTLATPEDTAITANVLTGTNGASADSFEDPTAAVISVTQPAHGTVTFTGAGAVSYTPALNYSGSDSFTYTVAAGFGTETATVSVNVTPVNDTPTISDLADTTTAEDTPTAALAFTVGDLETAAAGLTVTATSSNPTLVPNANLVLGGSGANRTLTATPAANQFGTTTITVTVSDGTASASDSFVLTVTAVDDAPTLAAIALAGTEDTIFTFTAANFTVAYADIEATPLASITVVTLPATGTLKLSGFDVTAGQAIPAASLGNLSYVPALNSNGPQSFTITASDGTLSSVATTVTLTLAAVNDAPVNTAPVAASLAEDVPFAFTATTAISVSDIDGNLATTSLAVTHGALTVALAGGATLSAGANASPSLTLSGTATQLNAALATLLYTPVADYNGPDTLTLLSTDSGTPALTATTTVALTIAPVTDIVADSLTTAEDTVLVSNVLTGTNGASADSFENPAAAVTAVTSATHGTVTFTAAGAITYTPELNFNGTDTFSYTVTSGGVSETAAITVTVAAVNDAPVNTVPGPQTTNANTALLFSASNGNALSLADVDAGAASLTVTLTANQGALTLGSVSGLTFTTGNGVTPSAVLQFSGPLSALNLALNGLTFLPTSGFSGAASLTFKTSDDGNTGAGGVLTDTASVAITVIDTISPTVVSLSSLTPDGHYRAGAVIDLGVAFSEPVTVNPAGGTPTLLLATGATHRTATYVSGGGSPVLVFRYVVAAGDTSDDLNHASPAALQLNGATLTDLAVPTANSAILTLPATAAGTPGALATAAALVIDTTAPLVTLSAPSAVTTSAGPIIYTVTYSDPHFAGSTLSASDLTLHRTSTDARLATANATLVVTGTGLTRTVTLSQITGDGLLSLSLAAGTAADLAGNLAPAIGPGEAITVQNTFPLAVVQPPASTAVAVGMPLILGATVTGTAPAFQWFKDNSPLSGATNATLEFAATPLAAAGTYRVTATNILGSVDSSTAAVTVFDVSAAQALTGPGYVPGQIVTVRNTVTFSGGDGTFTWSMLLPPGWSYAGGDFAGDTRPAAGATALLEWAWLSFPLSPVTFTVQLAAPANATGPQAIAAQVLFTRGAVTVPLLAKPDPLYLPEIGAHSADTDHDGRFNLFELLRVIELYNTRFGTVRTGAYAVATAPSEDGFAPALTRASGAPVSLETYHVADTDRDGAIGLFELSRVIELYNYREGTVRTGAFHRQSGTEDGFAPGPAAPSAP